MMLKKNKPFWIVLFFWLVSLVIVNPIGDFPLNDDWAYALSVKGWLETGQFQIIDWPAMSLFSHVAWGTLWAKIFGFSFTTLRCAVLCLGVISVFVFAKLLKELHFSWEQQLLALVVLVFNPLYFHLGNTFMTDVSFVAFCICCSFAFWRYCHTEKLYWWGISILFAVLAILVRQLGLFLPLAFGGALVLRRFSLRNIGLAVMGVATAYGSLIGYLWILEHTTGLPTTFEAIDNVVEDLHPRKLWEGSKSVLGYYPLYIGGFLLPVWLIAAKLGRSRLYWFSFIVISAIFGYYIWLCWDHLPLWNTVYDCGVGPTTLPDFLKRYSSMKVLSDGQWLLIKLGALLGAFFFLLAIVGGVERIWKKRSSQSATYTFRLGALLFVFGYLLYLLSDYYQFDRYMLPLMPFAILLARSEQRVSRLRLWGAVLIYIPVVYFSVAGTHDYLDWNRARWQALMDMEERGIPPDKIDGGYEYNGWRQTHHRNPSNRFAKSWWFVDDDQFAIAMTPYHNYEAIAIYPFQRYLTLSTDSILVLERPVFKDTLSLKYTHNAPMDSLYIRYNQQAYQLKEGAGEKDSRVCYISPNREYALQHKLFPVKPHEKVSIKYELRGAKKPFLVVNSAPNVDSFYYAHTPFVVEIGEDGWQKTIVEMQIPADYPSDTLDIYFWKQRADAELFIRDFALEWRRY